MPRADWVHTYLMLGMKLIVREWKATTLPPVSMWFTQLGIAVAHKGLAFRLVSQVEKYWAKWAEYIAYIHGP